MTTGVIFDIKEMSVHDGPGIRTTIFFKGCPLRCMWCHNPEGLSHNIEIKETGSDCLHCGLCYIPCYHSDCQTYHRCLHVCPQGRLSKCGKHFTASELIERIKPYQDILKTSGGVTISGGEPFYQSEFLLELVKALKPFHVAIETSAFAKPKLFRNIASLVDLMIIDIKHMESEKHQKWTGVDNAIILENIRWMKHENKPFIVRIPVIPNVNDSKDHFEKIACFLSDSRADIQVELLPYNRLAGVKYKTVGLCYNPEFNEENKSNLNCNIFKKFGINCKII